MNDHTRFSPDFDSRADDGPSFLRRALIAAAVLAAAVAVILLLWLAADVFVLIFAGVLLAVALGGAADWLARVTRLPRWAALAAVVAGVAGLLAAAGWLVGAELARQLRDVSADMTRSARDLEQQLRGYGWVPDSFRLPTAGEALSRKGTAARVIGAATVTVGVAADAAVVLFVGLFIAAQPRRYREGMLLLLPPARRGRAAEVLDEMGGKLRRWTAGRLIDMAIVGVLTYAGLYLLGIPGPLALSVLTALIVFVPYVGPVISAVPAVLVALTKSPEAALWTALLYLGIQTVESYLLQPFIQDRAVSLPPAVVLGSQLLLGVLIGTLGVMFATPLAAAASVAIRMLYVEDVLGDRPGGGEREPAPPAERQVPTAGRGGNESAPPATGAG